MNRNIKKIKNGFFIIELLISILIFCIISLIIFQYHASITLKQNEVNKTLKAINFLNNFADELIAGAAINSKIDYEDFIITTKQIYPTSNQHAQTKNQTNKVFKLYKIVIIWKDLNSKLNSLQVTVGTL